MEQKTLSITQKAQIKRMALIMKPMVKRLNLLDKKKEALEIEMKSIQFTIDTQYDATKAFLGNDEDLLKQADEIIAQMTGTYTEEPECPSHEEAGEEEEKETETKE